MINIDDKAFVETLDKQKLSLKDVVIDNIDNDINISISYCSMINSEYIYLISVFIVRQKYNLVYLAEFYGLKTKFSENDLLLKINIIKRTYKIEKLLEI